MDSREVRLTNSLGATRQRKCTPRSPGGVAALAALASVEVSRGESVQIS